MAKKKKINKNKESQIQRKFLRDVKVPQGQVRERNIKQEDKELILDQYSPVEVRDTQKRVVGVPLDLIPRFEDTDFGSAINSQQMTNNPDNSQRIEEQVDVVECHIYDIDDNLLDSTFVKKGTGWYFLGDGEKQFDSDTGKQKRYDKIIIEPHKVLRDAGFKRGTYRVHFNFHRNRLGSDKVFYIDTENEQKSFRNNDIQILVKPENVTTLADGSMVRTRGGKPTDRYVKSYQKKMFIQEISPSRTEIRALPVPSYCNTIDRKFFSEITGRDRNFELFDKDTKIISTEETGAFLTVDTYPEKGYGKKKAEPGTALVTISKRASAKREDVEKIFRFNQDMVGGVLTLPRRGISGVNTFDLYTDFEAEIVEYIDPQTVRVGMEFRQPTPIGDVNLDGKVNMLDFDKLFAYIRQEDKLHGLSQFQADLDQDGRVDLSDALWTLRIALQQVKDLTYIRQGNDILGKGALTADRIFGAANDILANYKMTAAQRTIFDINRDGRIDNIDLLRFLEEDVMNVVTEITEVMRRPFIIEYENPYYDERKNLNYLINFGNNDRRLVVNWDTDDVAYPDYPHSLIFKLYEPLPKSISSKTYFHIVEEITPSAIEDVVLTGEVQEKAQFKLRPPNWDNIDTRFIGKSEPVELSSWDNLLSTSSFTSQQLVDKYFSSSYAGVDLNIDYREYKNYVHFGSAAERLANFKYKMQLLESYSGSIAEESQVKGSTASVKGYQQKKSELLNSFDQYEKYLYYNSGSSFTDSYRDIPNTFWVNKTWPKTGEGTSSFEPYKLAKVDSEIATKWYEREFVSASAYDKQNQDSLINSLPLHLQENNENVEYHLFLDMIGQHFDTIWTYINNLTELNNTKEKMNEGIPKDLVYHTVKSMGYQLDLGTNVTQLWEFALGADATGSFQYGNKESYEDISKETWRRIGNNLPYILKHKGTARGIKALLACYGVPETIIKIREFGGPDAADKNLDSKLERDELKEYRDSSFIEDDHFIYAARFTGESNQYMTGSWTGSATTTPSGRFPDTVQFRFKTPSDSKSTDATTRERSQVLFQVGNEWAIVTKQSGSYSTKNNKGFVEFHLSGSGTSKVISTDKSVFSDGDMGTNIFTDTWTNVMIRRTNLTDNVAGASSPTQSYQLFVKQFDDETKRLVYDWSGSMMVSSSDVTYNNSWTGSGIAKTSNPKSFYLGGVSGGTSKFGRNFKGNMLEMRQWAGTLSQSAFENHTQAPQAYNGNAFFSSYDDMIVRWKMDQAQDYSTHQVKDLKPNQADEFKNNPLKHAKMEGFGSTDYDETYVTNRMSVPNIGPNRRADSKIRTNDNKLFYGRLSVNKRSERMLAETAPVESPKLGVYLSPGDLVNDDIMRTFAGADFDSLIGDPRDQYKDKYPDLELARYLYFRKFKEDPINLSDYMDIIKLYDLSLFDQLKRVMPARSKPAAGVLIEPSILERPKIAWKKPEVKDEYHQGEVILAPSESGEFPTYEGDIPDELIIPGGETPNYDGPGIIKPVTTDGSEDLYDGDGIQKPIITEGEETLYSNDNDPIEKPIITDGEETLYSNDKDPIDKPVFMDGEETLYEGPPMDKPTTVEGDTKDIKGVIEEKAVKVDGEDLTYGGIIPEEPMTIEGENPTYEGTLDRERVEEEEIEGKVNTLETTLSKPVNELEGEGNWKMNIEATWTNPHKNVSSEYNKLQYVYETSSVDPTSASYYEGVELRPRVVYTMSGSKFPSHYPDVEGDPVHNTLWQTEALQPMLQDVYKPEEQYLKVEEKIFETQFDAGMYSNAFQLENNKITDNENPYPEYNPNMPEGQYLNPDYKSNFPYGMKLWSVVWDTSGGITELQAIEQGRIVYGNDNTDSGGQDHSLTPLPGWIKGNLSDGSPRWIPNWPYLSNDKMKYREGSEIPGGAPKHFISSSVVDGRGLYSGSSYQPYVPTIITTNDEEELTIYKNPNEDSLHYLVDGPSGSVYSRIHGQKAQSAFQRTGKLKTFEVREFEKKLPNSLKINHTETAQGLYIENEISSSGFDVSSSMWPYEGLDMPSDIETQFGDGGSFYGRFGTKAAYEMEEMEQYFIEFRIQLADDSERILSQFDPERSSVTVHLLPDIDTPIDFDSESTLTNTWGSCLLKDVYKNSGFRKFFTVYKTGNYRIVFVLHGGMKAAPDVEPADWTPVQPQFKFFLTNFKLSHMGKASYNPVAGYSTQVENLFYNGCKQTQQTTTDGLPPWEVRTVSPTVLVVDPDGNTDLSVS